MRQRGLHADVRTLFTTPTLAGLAAAISEAPSEVDVPENRILQLGISMNDRDEDSDEEMEFAL
jgi:hypothetical protein